MDSAAETLSIEQGRIQDFLSKRKKSWLTASFFRNDDGWRLLKPRLASLSVQWQGPRSSSRVAAVGWKEKGKKRGKRKGRKTMRRMKRKGVILMVVKLDLLSTERRKKKGHTMQREWEKEGWGGWEGIGNWRRKSRVEEKGRWTRRREIMKSKSWIEVGG